MIQNTVEFNKLAILILILRHLMFADLRNRLAQCRHLILASLLSCLLLLTGCNGLPVVSAESRLFAPISLELIDDYALPEGAQFQDVPIGGLSGLSYDEKKGVFYAISDDRSGFAPARFYTLQPKVDVSKSTGQLEIKTIDFIAATVLKQENGEQYERNKIDPEGIALSPRGTVFVSSEGASKAGVPPFINEYDLATGAFVKALPVPDAYLPGMTEDGATKGVQENKGFEGLTLNVDASPDLIRLFAAIEAPLEQDKPLTATTSKESNKVPTNSKVPAIVKETAERSATEKRPPAKPEVTTEASATATASPTVTPSPATTPTKPEPDKIRMIHYALIPNRADLIGEYVYELDQGPIGTIEYGLSDILSIDNAGHFLALERSVGLTGFNGKIYQFTFAGARDIQQTSYLRGLPAVQPIKKKLLLDLADLGLTIDNVEGMALGPVLPDGSQSFWVISDDNFSKDQVTQFLLFRLNTATNS
jgi:hypothetical protein